MSSLWAWTKVKDAVHIQMWSDAALRCFGLSWSPFLSLSFRTFCRGAFNFLSSLLSVTLGEQLQLAIQLFSAIRDLMTHSSSKHSKSNSLGFTKLTLLMPLLNPWRQQPCQYLSSNTGPIWCFHTQLCSLWNSHKYDSTVPRRKMYVPELLWKTGILRGRGWMKGREESAGAEGQDDRKRKWWSVLDYRVTLKEATVPFCTILVFHSSRTVCSPLPTHHFFFPHHRNFPPPPVYEVSPAARWHRTSARQCSGVSQTFSQGRRESDHCPSPQHWETSGGGKQKGGGVKMRGRLTGDGR